MEAPAQLGIYVAVLRKHVPLLAVSALVVVAAGVVYVLRQEPVYSSSATLVIQAPARNLQTSGEFANQMQFDMTDLATQVHLLKEKPELAKRAIEKLSAAGVDTAAKGYTEGSFPSRVKVEPIPGTNAWNFSLTGSDAETLPQAVNAYAEVFQEWSEAKNESREEQQVSVFQRAVDDAEKKLRALEEKRSQLVAKNPDVNVAGGANLAQEELLTLPAPALLELEREADLATRRSIERALARSGVSIEEHEDGTVRLRAQVSAAELARSLVDDEHVTALACVRSNERIRDLLEQERTALEQDRTLAKADLKPDIAERVAARDAAAAAREKRGSAIAGVIEDELSALKSRVARNELMTTRRSDLQTKALVAAGLRQEYENLDKEVKAAERDVTRKSDELRDYKSRFLTEAVAEGQGGTATRRIRLETRAARSVQIAPKVPLIIGLTAFAAIAVGLGLVLLMEYLDDTVKSKEDFDRWVALPFLGFIPRIETKDADRPDLAADARTGSAIAEAFRAVRTSILFSRSGKPVRKILVTSAGPGEGKTTIATNLAVTLAKHKGPVLLVDADLRRPRVAKALGIENKVGLTNYLIGELTLDEVIQKTSIEGLWALTSGPVPPNPAELLHGDQLSAMLDKGLERFDRIVIDSPPLIAVSDARVIARCADGLYLVISMGKTSRRLIQRSLESLTSIGFNVHGAILNNVSAPTGRYGYYYYRDYNYGKSYYVQQPPATPGS